MKAPSYYKRSNDNGSLSLLFLLLLLQSITIQKVSACSPARTAVEGSFLLHNTFYTTADPNILSGTIVKTKACDNDIGRVDVTIDLTTGSVVKELEPDAPPLPLPTKDPTDGYSVSIDEEDNVVLMDKETGDVVVTFVIPNSKEIASGLFFVGNGIAYIFLVDYSEYSLDLAMVDLDTLEIKNTEETGTIDDYIINGQVSQVYDNYLQEDDGDDNGDGIVFFQGASSLCAGLVVFSFNTKGIYFINKDSNIHPLYNHGSKDSSHLNPASPTLFLQKVFGNSFFYTLRYVFSYDDTDLCANEAPIKRSDKFIITKKSLTEPNTILEEYTLNADDIESIGNTIKNDVVVVPICFSGDATVEVEYKGIVAMKDLKLNDRIMVNHDGKFEPIYGFGHGGSSSNNNNNAIKMLKIMPLGLEISDTHMIFTNRKGFIPASMIKIGDELTNDVIVTGIQNITTSAGVYAPFTPSGKLLVNGVLVSNFVAFQNSNMLNILGIDFLSFHNLAYTFESTHRIWCYHLGPCKVETYNSDGISTWVEKPFNFIQTIFQTKEANNSYNYYLLLCLILPLGTIITCFMSIIETFFFTQSLTLIVLPLWIIYLLRSKKI